MWNTRHRSVDLCLVFQICGPESDSHSTILLKHLKSNCICCIKIINIIAGHPLITESRLWAPDPPVHMSEAPERTDWGPNGSWWPENNKNNQTLWCQLTVSHDSCNNCISINARRYICTHTHTFVLLNFYLCEDPDWHNVFPNNDPNLNLSLTIETKSWTINQPFEAVTTRWKTDWTVRVSI